MSAFEMTLAIPAILLALTALGFWATMIRHCWLNTTSNSRERWVWLLIVVVGKLPGAVAYYLLRKDPTLA